LYNERAIFFETGRATLTTDDVGGLSPDITGLRVSDSALLMSRRVARRRNIAGNKLIIIDRDYRPVVNGTPVTVLRIADVVFVIRQETIEAVHTGRDDEHSVRVDITEAPGVVVRVFVYDKKRKFR